MSYSAKGSSQTTSTVELSRRLTNGDERAFEEIFYLYYKHLYAIAVAFLKDPMLAQDAVQDVFLKLWQHREHINEAYSLKAFLSVSMKNHVLNQLRDNHQAVLCALPTDDDEQVPTATERTDEAVQWQAFTDAFEQSIQLLSPQKQAVFRLRVIDGLTNEQTAQRLSISVNTVKTHYAQAMQAVRGQLSKYALIELTILLFFAPF